MTLPVVLMLAVTAQGPIAASVQKEARALATPHDHYEDVPLRSPTLVWVGVGVLAIGILAAIAATTVEQQSDLDEEAPNVRLNSDLAPCRTDPDDTNLPIADCKVNIALLTTGLALTGAGGALILYGSQPVSTHGPSVQFRVRF